MKLRDEIKDWIIPSLLLTPHAILLATILIIESEERSSAQTISSLLSMTANIATAIGVFWAIYTANMWRTSLISERKIHYNENLLKILVSVSEQHKNIIKTTFQPVANSILNSSEGVEIKTNELKYATCKSFFDTITGVSQDEYLIKLRNSRLDLKKEIKSSFMPLTDPAEKILDSACAYFERLFQAYGFLSATYCSRNTFSYSTLSDDQEIIESLASGSSIDIIDDYVANLKLELRQSLGLSS